jgi:hypothetical protein
MAKPDNSTPDRQTRRLIGLASNFPEAVKDLPQDAQNELLHQQREVAATRRRAQSNERLLRMRIK